MGRKSKRAKKITMPKQGDTGPDTPAQRAGAVVLEVQDGGGPVFCRKRRDNHLIKMATPNGKRCAIITMRQAAAGIKLEEAWNNTELSPGPAWTRVYVDCTPRPGDVDTNKLEASRAYSDLRMLIPKDCRHVVEAVCCAGYSIKPGLTNDTRRSATLKYRLRRGLGVLARELKI